MATLGEKIREARGSMSQENLAELAGISRVTLARAETDRQVPSVETLWRVSRITGKDPGWFLEGVDLTSDRLSALVHMVYPERPVPPPFVTNILPDILEGAGVTAKPSPPPDPGPGEVDMHALLAQLVQSQTHLSQAMARMAEGQEELRKGQSEIAQAVADLAAQEQGATRTDARRRRERAG